MAKEKKLVQSITHRETKILSQWYTDVVREGKINSDYSGVKGMSELSSERICNMGK